MDKSNARENFSALLYPQAKLQFISPARYCRTGG